MWKDFFYFSKSQRTGIFVLLLLIILTLLSTFLMPYLIKTNKIDSDSAFLEEAEKFKANLREKDRSKQNQYEEYPNFYKPFSKKDYNKSTAYQLFTFNPNTADSADFVRLGLKSYVAKNILKYRSKGGKFNSADDFAKIYGISADKFQELKPYIQLPEPAEKTSVSETKVSVIKTDENSAPIADVAQRNTVVELNSADTASLMQISGIGRSLAKGIVGYRRILGGYYSVEQLREVYGMRPENFEKIKHSLTADGAEINKINVNRAGIERLKSHPYIKTFEKARAIYEYRRKKVRLNSIEDLEVLDELNQDDLRRLEPYLDFSTP